MEPSLGFIGLGAMGRPMCANLLDAGYRVTVHNRSRTVVEEMTAAGAEPAQGSAEVAQKADLILTCLPDTDDVRSVVLGEGGVLEGLSPGKTWIDMSTISPDATREMGSLLVDKGARMLDAPTNSAE